jgi:hypothetical protein
MYTNTCEDTIDVPTTWQNNTSKWHWNPVETGSLSHGISSVVARYVNLYLRMYLGKGSYFNNNCTHFIPYLCKFSGKHQKMYGVAIWVAPTMSPSLLTSSRFLDCGRIVSLAQAFLHCKTFSSDVAEYRICKATFYSTQQWTEPLFRLKKKCSGWRAALTRKPQGETL